MTFNPEISLGNLLTIGTIFATIVVAWARLSSGLSSLSADSERRFQANGARIDTLDNDVKKMNDLTPRCLALEVRMTAAEVSIGKLQHQNAEIATLATEMSWVKGTVMAIAGKLGVIPTDK